MTLAIKKHLAITFQGVLLVDDMGSIVEARPLP